MRQRGGGSGGSCVLLRRWLLWGCVVAVLLCWWRLSLGCAVGFVLALLVCCACWLCLAAAVLVACLLCWWCWPVDFAGMAGGSCMGVGGTIGGPYIALV